MTVLIDCKACGGKGCHVCGGAGKVKARGFAAMDRTLVSVIAKKGGLAAHQAGTAHEFTSEEARLAGQKGGRAAHAKRKAAG